MLMLVTANTWENIGMIYVPLPGKRGSSPIPHFNDHHWEGVALERYDWVRSGTLG